MMKTTGAFLFLIITFCVAEAQETGCILGNCTNGVGTYLWESGDEYTGEWVNGARTGLGVYDWGNGTFYYGYFRNNKLEGKGFYLGKEAKNNLSGIFHDGILAEKLTMESTGCVLGNCQNGVGLYIWETNDVYIGEWVNESRTGYGRYDWPDGSTYIGYLKEGKLHGRGEHVSKDGKVMSGEFVENEFIGETK